MSEGNFWDSNVWSLVLIVGVLGCAMLIASLLKKWIKPLRNLLLPSSVLGGIILLIISSVCYFATGTYLFDYKIFSLGQTSGMAVLEIITYHCLGLGFVAMALRKNDKKITGARVGEVLNSGFTTVATYLLQAILGITITIVAVWLGSSVWEGAGILLPLGYGQGTGQAMNFGNIYGSGDQIWGFATPESGKSFGLAVAAMGFVSACIGGVIFMNLQRKRGKIVVPTNSDDDSANYTIEQILGKNEIPVTGSVDKLTVQISVVMGVYAISYFAMWGLCELLHLGESMKATIFGFNFLLGTLIGILFKTIMGYCNKKRIFKRSLLNTFMLNRIGGFVFDVMIVAGISAIRIDTLIDYWAVLLALGIFGAFATYFYILFVSKKLFPAYSNEQFLGFYGMLTGTASTGVILLREIDPSFSSPVADNLVYQNLPAIALGFPIMLLCSYIYEGGSMAVYVVLAIAIATFAILNVVLFRSKIFKPKNKSSATETPDKQ